MLKIRRFAYKLLDALGNIINPANAENQATIIANQETAIALVQNTTDEDNYFSQFLLETATKDMAVDGTTPKVYRYTVPASTEIRLTRSMITIEDGASAFNPANFGAIAGSLANGVEVSITPLGGAKVILETWLNNREIRNCFFDFDQSFKADGAYVGRWTFTKDLNGLIYLTAGDVFDITIQDNLSGLDYMSFRIKGRKTIV